jgi:hypothetical protein
MKTNLFSLPHLTGVAGLACAFLLSGCSSGFNGGVNTSGLTTMHIQGVVHGGQQPLNGAHVYMYSPGTTAYGGSGVAASAATDSVSLLTDAPGVTLSDGSRYYVTTDQNGNFNIDGAFACTPGTQVYLYSIGGDAQFTGTGTPTGNNPAATLMSVVGDCASATPGAAFPNATFISMNEITTVAAAYALAGFATDGTHLGAPSSLSGHSLALTGLANAFSTALNLVNQATGQPAATTKAAGSNGTVPVKLINSLADILASCINSTGSSSSGCATLFQNAKNSAGNKATDTAMAAIYIAQNPKAHVSALLDLATNAGPFQPILNYAADFTLAITYSGLNKPYGVAVDGVGNVWVTNSGTTGANANSVTMFSPAGVVTAGCTACSGGDYAAPMGIAIDAENHPWVANSGSTGSHGYHLTEILSNAGSTSTPIGGALKAPQAVDVGSEGDIWIANTGANNVIEFNVSTQTGTTFSGIPWPQSIAAGKRNQRISAIGSFPLYSIADGASAAVGELGFNPFLINPLGIALEQSDNLFVAGSVLSAGSLTQTNPSLQNVVSYDVVNLFFNNPQYVAIDGADTVWLSNLGGGNLTRRSVAGTLSNVSAGGTLSCAEGIASDLSGNVWVANSGNNTISEIVGLGTPVVTPLVANLLSPYNTPASKP